MEERISCVQDTIENIDPTVKENAKCKKLITQNIQEIQDTVRRPNLRTTGIEESKDFQLKGPVNILNKIIEENLPNQKKEIPPKHTSSLHNPNRKTYKKPTEPQIDWTRKEIRPII